MDLSSFMAVDWCHVHKLAASGDVQGLIDCAKTTDLLTMTSKHAVNAMHIAARRGQVAVVAFLLKHFPTMSEQIILQSNDTVLHCALEGGNVALLELLLMQCSDDIVHGMNLHDMTPVVCAVCNGWTNMAITIINQKPHVLYDCYLDESLLHFAAANNNCEMVQYLLKIAPTLTKARTQYGETAMHFAHDCAITELLYRADPAMVHVRDATGTSPFLYAIFRKDVKLVNVLLDMCPEVIHHEESHGLNALHMTRDCDIARILLQRKPELIDGITKNGDTPLHYAACAFDASMVQLLLEHKPELLQRRNHRQQAPLYCATNDIVNTILRFQPDLIDIDEDGNSSLHRAVRAGDNDVIALVFVHQMQSLDVTNRQQQTPMHDAVNRHHKFAVELFQRHIRVETALEVRQTCINNCGVDPNNILDAYVSRHLLPELLHIVYDFVSEHNTHHKRKHHNTL